MYLYLYLYLVVMYLFPLKSVAAPDHKIRQCIQRSALFPGRADGRTEDPERDARSGAKRRSAKRVGSGEIRGSAWGLCPQKNLQKSTLKWRIFCNFAN